MSRLLNALFTDLEPDPRWQLEMIVDLEIIYIKVKRDPTGTISLREEHPGIIYLTRIRECGDKTEFIGNKYAAADPELIEKIKRDIEPLLDRP